MTAPAVARRWSDGFELAPGVRQRAVRLRPHVPLAAVLLTGIAVHVAVAPHLAIRGAAPEMLLVAVVAVAANRGPRAGAAFGFAAGIGADLFLATPAGTTALAFTLVGHVLGRSNRAGARRAPFRRAAFHRSVMLTAFGVAAGQLGTAAVATTLAGLPFPGLPGLLQMAVVAAVSAPFGPPVFAVVRHLPKAGGRP